MSNRDFFAFCTSLKPIELKALGSLSKVRHLPPGEIIYRSGDPSDSLYIINRGLVEVIQDGKPGGLGGTYLSRGDIFGDVEILTDLPRKYSVRTQEEVSLQCFHREHLAELSRRVPTFFHYLSEKLAVRLTRARDAALARSDCTELGGTLANFDLITIYQTIVNSSQTGELSVIDDQGDLVAAFYFEAGQPRNGQFQHLTGEEAFSQLFLAENLRGTFCFASGPPRISKAIQNKEFERNSDEMLINAVRGRDEMRILRDELSEPSSYLQRLRSELAVGEITPQLRSTAEELWALMADAPLPLRELYSKSDRCELKIHQTASELLRTGNCALVSMPEAEKAIA